MNIKTQRSLYFRLSGPFIVIIGLWAELSSLHENAITVEPYSLLYRAVQTDAIMGIYFPFMSLEKYI